MRASLINLMRNLSPEAKARIQQISYLPNGPRDILYCLWNRLERKSTWRFHGLPLIEQRTKDSIRIGSHFTATSDSRYNSLGVSQRVVIKALTVRSRIRIGNHVGLSGCTLSCRERIDVGNYVLIGTGALVTDHDAHQMIAHDRRTNTGSINSAPVVINDNVFIGARAIILKGVEIGECCIVGAGAVVTRSVPPNTIVAGNPAKFVGECS